MHALHGAQPAQPVTSESKLLDLHSSWPCWPLLHTLPRPRQDRAGPIYVGHLDVASRHLLLFDKDPAVRDRGLNVGQSDQPLTT